MHFLFIKSDLAWPRGSGHDVHTYYMMRELGMLGHQVSLSTRAEPSQEALQGLRLTELHRWAEDEVRSAPVVTGWQERFRSYWGIENEWIHAIAHQAEECRADVVVAVGLEVLPLLAGVRRSRRVWYAADEWVWHHLSVIRLADRTTWNHLRTAIIKGLYEFSYRSVVDSAWVVSPADRRAMRLFSGIRQVDVVPNGVDTDHYAPLGNPDIPNTCVFWGRLDFEPNIQALEWFCLAVWPRVLQRCPTAIFRIFGFQPGEKVRRLTDLRGIRLEANLADLRVEIDRSAIVVLPFRSGGGIKNKLLEAAAMAKPIVCSQLASNGLTLSSDHPLTFANHPSQWVDALCSLWADEPRRRFLGQAARRWVIDAHSWESSARIAAQSVTDERLDRLAVTT